MASLQFVKRDSSIIQKRTKICSVQNVVMAEITEHSVVVMDTAQDRIYVSLSWAINNEVI